MVAAHEQRVRLAVLRKRALTLSPLFVEMNLVPHWSRLRGYGFRLSFTVAMIRTSDDW